MIDLPLVLLLLLVTVLLVIGAASALSGIVLIRDARYWRRERHYAEWRRYQRIGALALAGGVPGLAGGFGLLMLLGRIVGLR